jgi:hypothetical protein
MQQCIRRFTTALLVFLGTFLSVLPAYAAGSTTRVLSIPEYPFRIVFTEKDGRIVKAFFRAPGYLRSLPEVEGLRYSAQHLTVWHADLDWRRDVLWRLSFVDPEHQEKGQFLWFGALSGSSQFWLVASPAGTSLWDTIPLKITAPLGTSLYVSPSTPAYQAAGEDTEGASLSFIYTISLTENGPCFVNVPDVYQQLLPVTTLVASHETDKGRRKAYSLLLQDFEALAKSEQVSLESIMNLSWKQLLTGRWNP